MIKPVTVAALALGALVAVPAAPTPAQATDWDWSMSANPSAKKRYKARKRYVKRQTQTADSGGDATKVMGYVRREGEADMRPQLQCAEKVRGLGTQWIGTEGAMDAAKKDWMERVRYDYGESFLDMTNAKDFVSRCGRTSIGETMGQVMYRCEIVARPCKGLMQEVSAVKK